MPVRPEFRKFYAGPGWRATRDRIRERAGNRCELCGVPNGAVVTRLGGMWWDDKSQHWRGSAGAAPFRAVKIVCTVAHLNHTPGDDRDENLLFLCQYDHLLLDLAEHRRTRQVRKDRARPLLEVL